MCNPVLRCAGLLLGSWLVTCPGRKGWLVNLRHDLYIKAGRQLRSLSRHTISGRPAVESLPSGDDVRCIVPGLAPFPSRYGRRGR